MPRQIPINNFNANLLLVGSNLNSLPFRYGLTDIADLPDEIANPTSFVGNNNTIYDSISTAGIRSQLKIKLLSETSKEFGDIMDPQYYSNVSIMSLDGILSPVSFYPSNWSSTFNMTLYSRSSCPWCNGVGTYESVGPSRDIATWPSTESFGTNTCPFCMVDDDKAKQTRQTVNIGSEVEPPHIITDSDDTSTTIDDINAGDEFSLVNRFTLNPIVMRNGEFSNPPGRQDGDTSAHCIDIVGVGSSPPSNGQSVRSLMSNTSDNFISDYNQRFMALRGPLMLHSWGYDIHGYPVPNQSGEYKIGPGGSIVTDNDGNPVYATQQQDSDGDWSDPTPSHKFRKGWAQLAHKWPVGPIDLRWDDNAGVWTIGSNYKNVWITIETDLTAKGAVVRGAMYQEGPTTLPNGQRKVVFVKDSLGLASAPRKATLYCKYNQDNGFYQPLVNNSLTTTGDILSSSSADIKTSYSIDPAEKTKTYTTSFENPLSLSVAGASKGIFSFIDGNWVLVNAK